MSGAMAYLAAGACAGALAGEVLRARRLVRRLRAIALSCHELRGALTALDLALSRAEGRTAAPAGAALEEVRQGYERAAAVVRDLEVARGAVPPGLAQRPELVDLRDVSRRVVRSWNASRPPGELPIALEWGAGAAVVEGFPLRLGQALDNLVANAIEHGRGPVTVTGRTVAGWVSVSVLDRGAGLARPLDHVRPGDWRARRGHGLVVARHAAELHGGALRPVRLPGGAGIEIRLPAAAAPPPVPAKSRPRLPRRSGSGAAAS